MPRPDKVKTCAQNKPTTHNKRVSDCRQGGREREWRGGGEREEGGTDRGREKLKMGDNEE